MPPVMADPERTVDPAAVAPAPEVSTRAMGWNRRTRVLSCEAHEIGLRAGFPERLNVRSHHTNTVSVFRRVSVEGGGDEVPVTTATYRNDENLTLVVTSV